MAYHCKKGSGECIACGACEDKPVMYDYLDQPIYEGDKYYDFDGVIVSEDSLSDYVDEYKRTAGGF